MTQWTNTGRWTVVAAMLAAAACDSGGQPALSGSSGAAPAVALAAVPAPYAGKTNPVGNDPVALEAGKKTFTTYCVSCHGDSGRGDGPASAVLNPKPRNLSDRDYVMTLGDDRMFWRISEGGASGPPNSAMPQWKASLKEEEVWQVVAYVRSLAK